MIFQGYSKHTDRTILLLATIPNVIHRTEDVFVDKKYGLYFQ